MASAGTLAARSRWGSFDRVAIIVLLVVFTLGAPGLGFETRQGSDNSLADVAYGVMFLAPLLALIASWKLPLPAAWVGAVGGLATVVVSALDLAGVLIGPPPVTMVAVDAAVVVAGLAVAWRCWRIARG